MPNSTQDVNTKSGTPQQTKSK